MIRMVHCREKNGDAAENVLPTLKRLFGPKF